ncbi:dTDP-4-amino-4,6-dideoxygalactose transaminase [Paraburkholderia sp. GAS448]|uniref:DegT/DnrJ/EryC1/StrS family aminotransferase n=1 Tax=Paraburkholderia sp. GAS448 TaxID=3035136 RepID=UPI003D1C5B6C
MDSLAILGGTPQLSQPLQFGQHYFPSWSRYESVFRDIFERQYYTNHGPLAQQLEARLATLLQVKHAICITNGMIALSIATQAQELKGKIILPAWSNAAVVGSVRMAGLEPLFCDVDPRTAGLTAVQVEPFLGPGVAAILASNVGGDACEVAALQTLSERAGVALYFDSAQALGCRMNGAPLGGFGRIEIFSLHSEDLLSATEGGCICTNDDALAAKVRNIRGNYGRGHFVPVVKTGNGRMSEAQAAIALLNLDELTTHQEHNDKIFRAYQQRLADIPGVRLRIPAQVEHSNHQCVTCEIDEAEFGLTTRELVAAFRAENIEVRDSQSTASYTCVPSALREAQDNGRMPVSERLAAVMLQLPTGARVDVAMVERVVSVLALARLHAATIRRTLSANCNATSSY